MQGSNEGKVSFERTCVESESIVALKRKYIRYMPFFKMIYKSLQKWSRIFISNIFCETHKSGLNTYPLITVSAVSENRVPQTFFYVKKLFKILGLEKIIYVEKIVKNWWSEKYYQVGKDIKIKCTDWGIALRSTIKTDGSLLGATFIQKLIQNQLS